MIEVLRFGVLVFLIIGAGALLVGAYDWLVRRYGK